MSEPRTTNFPWTRAALRGLRSLWPPPEARGRRRFAIFAIVLLAVLAVHAGLVRWAEARLRAAVDQVEARHGSLAPASFAPEPVEPADNRARAIRAATAMFVPLDDRKGAVWDLAHGRGNDDDLAPAREAIEANGVAWDLLDEARRRGGSDWDLRYSDGIHMRLPNLLELLALSRTATAEARIALAEDRVDDALDALDRAAAVPASLLPESSLIVQLVGIAMEQDVLETSLDVIRARPLDGAALDRIDAWASRDDLTADLARGLRHEAADVVDLFTGRGGLGDGEGSATDAVLEAVLEPARVDGIAAYLGLMGETLDRLATPRPARDEPVDLEERLRFWHVGVGSMWVNTYNVIDRIDLAETRRGLVRATVALERARLATGAYPGSLDDLPGGVPVNDPFTGEPFAYRTEGDGFSLSSAASDPAAAGLDPDQLLGLEPERFVVEVRRSYGSEYGNFSRGLARDAPTGLNRIQASH